MSQVCDDRVSCGCTRSSCPGRSPSARLGCPIGVTRPGAFSTLEGRTHRGGRRRDDHRRACEQQGGPRRPGASPAPGPAFPPASVRPGAPVLTGDAGRALHRGRGGRTPPAGAGRSDHRPGHVRGTDRRPGVGARRRVAGRGRALRVAPVPAAEDRARRGVRGPDPAGRSPVAATDDRVRQPQQRGPGGQGRNGHLGAASRGDRRNGRGGGFGADRGRGRSAGLPHRPAVVRADRRRVYHRRRVFGGRRARRASPPAQGTGPGRPVDRGDRADPGRSGPSERPEPPSGRPR